MKKISVKLLTAAALIAAVGTSTLTLASCNQQGGGESSSSTVVVNSATIDQQNPSVDAGSTLQLTVTTDPAQLPVSWSSSDPSIATVSDTGLVTGIAIGSCKIIANIANGAATREVVLTVTNPDDKIAGKITVDYDKLPSEIALGSKNAINLEDYVTVSKVSSWSLTTDSDTIQIDGHKIIGLATGDFSVTIIAGTSKRAITGKVVSENKLKFNEFIGSIGSNFESYSALTGYYLLADNYYASLSGRDTTTGKYVFQGSALNKNDSKNYGFSINATVDSTGNVFTFDDEATFAPGYAGGRESEGISEFSTSATAFVEMTDKGVPVSGTDDDGNVYYVYTLNETSSSSTVLSDFYSGIGADAWYFLQSRVGATYAAILYFPESGVLNVIPANEEGLIGNFTYGTQTYSATVMVSNIGEVSIPALDKWVASPVVPEQIDVTPLQTFFTNLLDKKSMTLNGYGQWVDGDGSNIDCPDNMKFSDTGNGVFGNWSIKIAASKTMYETTVISMDEGYEYATASENHDALGASGTTSVEWVEEGLYKSATGTYNASDSTYAYDKDSVKSEESSVTDLWDKNVMLGYVFGEGKVDGSNLLGMTSFYEKEVGADNSVSYYYNGYGDDINYGLSDGYNVGTMSLSSLLLGYCGYYTSLWIQLQEWGDYVTRCFTLSEDGSELSASFVFQVSSSVYYTWGFTISDVGTDNVSAAAKALVTPASSGTDAE